MGNSIKSVKTCVVIDFPSDKNRGDAAMHVALLRMLLTRFQKSNLSILSWYGSNQQKCFCDEYVETLKEDIPVLPGLRNTYYDFPSFGRNRFKRLKVLYSLLSSFFKLGILYLSKDMFRFLLNSTELNSFRRIDEADFIVWNGRNFRGSNRWSEIYTALILTYHALICHALNKAVFCFGISLWKYESPLAKHLVTYCLRKCKTVTVREAISLEIMSSDIYLSSVNFRYSPDLSLPFVASARENNKKDTQNRKRVALTVVEWDKAGNDVVLSYVKSISRAINALLSEGYEVIITPQVTAAGQSNSNVMKMLTQSISTNYASQVTIIKKELDVKELCNIYADCEFIIATRMHSAIFSASVGTPAVCIAYDYGSKWGIVEDFGMRVLNYANFSAEELILEIRKIQDQCDEKSKFALEKFNARLSQIDDHFYELDEQL